MKKIIFCLTATFLMLTFIPVSINAETVTMSDSLAFSKLAGRDDFLVMFYKTKGTDLSDLIQSEKNNMHRMKRSTCIHNDNGMKNGTFISVGGSLLLTILVIVLIK